MIWSESDTFLGKQSIFDQIFKICMFKNSNAEIEQNHFEMTKSKLLLKNFLRLSDN